MDSLIVSDLMSSPVHVAGPADTIAHLRNIMLKHRISRVPILDDGRLVGMVTKKDLGSRLRRHDPSWRHRSADYEPIRVLMAEDIICVSPGTSCRDAMLLMINHKISGMPVLDQGMIIGMITRSDMMRSHLVQKLAISASSLMNVPDTVTIGHSLDHVLALISTKFGRVVVLDCEGRAVGIISDTDLALHEGQKGESEHTCAGDVMRSPVITLPSTSGIQEVIRLMQYNKVSSVVIADEDRVKGIITRDDIIEEVVL